MKRGLELLQMLVEAEPFNDYSYKWKQQLLLEVHDLLYEEDYITLKKYLERDGDDE